MTQTGASIGPTMEHEMYWHCSADINKTHVILMGGNENGFRPYIFNLNNFDELFFGSELSFTRKGCAATQIIHPNGTAFIIIIGPYDSSEILNTDNIFSEWMTGMIEIIYHLIRQDVKILKCGCTMLFILTIIIN